MSRAERLQKVMARAGVASRRHSEELILRGQVRVDGRVVRELGVKIDPTASSLEVMGHKVDLRAPREYLLMNKPRACLTTLRDPFHRKTVIDLLGPSHKGVYPAGRLDYDSEGLLLLTNDGELAYRLTHPKYKVAKAYMVEVRGRPSVQSLWKLRQGVRLEDGMTRPARVRIADRTERTTWLEITISEGRKRQVRRMCQAIGHPVVQLIRTAIGPLRLADLPVGQTRALTHTEVEELKARVGL